MTQVNENTKLCQMLHEKGFSFGWVLAGEILVLWEHDAEPPAPLTRPEPIEPTKP